MTRKVGDALLMAYLDGELPNAHVIAVDQALAVSSELRERERELREVLGDLLLEFSQLEVIDAQTSAWIATPSGALFVIGGPRDVGVRQGVNVSSATLNARQFVGPSDASADRRVAYPGSRPRMLGRERVK